VVPGNLVVPGKLQVLEAAQRIADKVHRTPIFTSRALDELAGCNVYFKCENLQRTGSFKLRGATNAALVNAKIAAAGLVTHSSGNHGAALAAAGRDLGLAVTVVMPDNAPATKKANVEHYGAQIVYCGPTIADREAALAEVQSAGGLFVPPYNHADVIAGQGTLALEFVDQEDALAQLWVPVGGGGMVSGCIAAVGAQLQVMGAEPELADDAFESLRTGKLHGPRPPLSIADGLRGALGELTFAMLRTYELPILRVAESEIVSAQRLLMDCLKLVVEPSGAVAFAALLARQRSPQRASAATRVGVVISGGNLDLQLAGLPEAS
jgi:threonine dehydratase/serine racemase